MNTLTQTIIPDLTEANYTNGIDFLSKYTTYLDVLNDFANDISTYLTYNKAQNESDFVNKTVSFFSTIDKDYDNIDNQFLMFWIKKYNQSVDSFIDIVQQRLGKNNVFTDLSDSIGILANTSYMLTDSVIPFNDIASTTYPAPITYPATLANKIRPTSSAIAKKLSQTTTAMFRQNIINIQTVYATSNEAHSSNLITDIQSYTRARQYVGSLVNKLEVDLGHMFKLAGYVSNINDYTGVNPTDYTMNTSAIGRFSFLITAQGNKVEVDLLGKKLRSARSSLTIANALMITTLSNL